MYTEGKCCIHEISRQIRRRLFYNLSVICVVQCDCDYIQKLVYIQKYNLILLELYDSECMYVETK